MCYVCIIVVWQCDSVSVRQCDSRTMWQCDSVTVWQYDIVTVWHCDRMTVWQCARKSGTSGWWMRGRVCQHTVSLPLWSVVTVIHSTLEYCKKLKSLLGIPEDCFHIIKDAGHLAMLEKPVEVNKIVWKLLAELSCWVLIGHMIRLSTIFAEFVFFTLLYGIQPSKCLCQTLIILLWIKTRAHNSGWLKSSSCQF